MAFTSTASETAAAPVRNPRFYAKRPKPIATGGVGKSVAGRASASSDADPCQNYDIEAEMVGLFRPPSQSTGEGGSPVTAAGDVFSSSPTVAMPLTPSTSGSASGSSSDDSSDAASDVDSDAETTSEQRLLSTLPEVDVARDQLAEKLDQIEAAFMNAQIVASSNVCEADLVQMFDKTTMNATPKDSIQYMADMADTVTQDSIHCGAPMMIGEHAPYPCRSCAMSTSHVAHVVRVTVRSQRSFTWCAFAWP
jgi:hypothetical protein